MFKTLIGKKNPKSVISASSYSIKPPISSQSLEEQVKEKQTSQTIQFAYVTAWRMDGEGFHGSVIPALLLRGDDVKHNDVYVITDNSCSWLPRPPDSHLGPFLLQFFWRGVKFLQKSAFWFIAELLWNYLSHLSRFKCIYPYLHRTAENKVVLHAIKYMLETICPYLHIT